MRNTQLIYSISYYFYFIYKLKQRVVHSFKTLELNGVKGTIQA